jgi:hypothetical protein
MQTLERKVSVKNINATFLQITILHYNEIIIVV